MSSGNGHETSGIVLHSNGEDFAVETEPGAFVPEIDPVTRKPTGEAKRFRMATGAPVAASLLPPPTRIHPRKVADLSAAERSKLLDTIVAEINELATKHNGLVRGVSADVQELKRLVSEHRAILDAHAGVVYRMTLWARLRWILWGV